jgi:DNA-binding Lrp family transcriptional regulator
MRKRLERDGYILDYTAIPNIAKLGFEIVAFTFINIDKYDQKTGELDSALGDRAQKWLDNHSKIIYATGGEGLEGKNCLLVSVHRDFTDFSDFISDLRAQWTPHMKNMDSFLMSTKGKMPKPFSFRNLEILL